jgi:predicted phage terminase large subunit-like protein
VELNLEAIAETLPDPLGRSLGQALWPDRYNPEALARIRSVLEANEGARSWYSLYQGKPYPATGDFFKVENLKTVDAEPVGLRKCRGWDLAATQGDGDYTAGVLVGIDAAKRIYICDVQREQWGPDEADTALQNTASADGRTVKIRGAIDPGSAGKRDALGIARMLVGYDIKLEHITGPKTTRARNFAAQVNAGNVTLVRGDWNKAFKDELRAFPGGKKDDQVDAASDAFNELTLPPEEQNHIQIDNRMGARSSDVYSSIFGASSSRSLRR